MVIEKKKISIVVACFNERENAEPIYRAIRDVMSALPAYDFEILFIDNGSTDGTDHILRDLAHLDEAHVKVILNARNFGTVRSHPYGFKQATGDAIVSISADFQDPPEMIPKFVQLWEEGNYIVYAETVREQNIGILSYIRRVYYAMANKLSDGNLIENFSGFGLYDRKVIDLFKEIDDPYPYFRGTIAELGLKRAAVPFVKPPRRSGDSKNNFLHLYDIAMNGITSHSTTPLHLVTLFGFCLSVLSFIVGLFYLGYKIYNWESFSVGIAPVVIGLFFFNSVIVFILGLIGEYVAFINVRVIKFPMVVERERLNFSKPRET